MEYWNVGCYGKIKTRGQHMRVLPSSATPLSQISQTLWECHQTSLPLLPPMVEFNGQLHSWDTERQGGGPESQLSDLMLQGSIKKRISQMMKEISTKLSAIKKRHGNPPIPSAVHVIIRRRWRRILTQHFYYLDMFMKVPPKKANLSNSVFLFMFLKGYAPLKTGFQETDKQANAKHIHGDNKTNKSIKMLPLPRLLLGLYPLCKTRFA